MNELQAQWVKWQEAFLTLPEARRKFWLGIVTFTVIYLGGWLSFMPAYEELTRAEQQTQQQQSLITGLERAISDAQEEIKGDPTAPLERKRIQLQQRLSAIDSQLSAQTNYVSASDNRALLKALLSSGAGIKIKSAQAAPVELVYQDPQNENSGIFKHRLQLVLVGSYFQIRDYFEQIEGLPWSFYWSRMDYRVSEYPQAELQLEIYTLSLERDYVAS